MRSSSDPDGLRPRRHRTPIVGAALIAAIALSGCGGLASPDTVARVGESTLTRSQFDELLTGTAGAEPGEQLTVGRPVVVDILNTWIITEILADELDSAGISITDEQRQNAIAELGSVYGPQWQVSTPDALRELQIRQYSVVNTWSETPSEPIDDEALAEIYAQGPAASGIACSAHILAETEAEASEVLELLAQGAEFDGLARERSIDSGSAVAGGFLGCMRTAEFTQMFIPEFVEAGLNATIGVPVGPVATRFGYHVIVIPDFDSVADEPLADLLGDPQSRFQRAARSADVHVAPRFGTFDPATGVTALG